MRRLLHFQTVGWSDGTNIANGHVSSHVCQRDGTGWYEHTKRALGPLVTRLGKGTFDWWGSGIAGIWYPFVPLYEGKIGTLRYEAMSLAAQEFPELVDYRTLDSFARKCGMDLYGYVGIPRYDEGFDFEPVPEHGTTETFDTIFDPITRYSTFKGIGFDTSSVLPDGSPFLTTVVPHMQAVGLEPFVESVPWKGASSSRFYGLGCVAESWAWDRAAIDANIYSADEWMVVGGNVVQLVLRPSPDWNYPTASLRNNFRFNKARHLLSQGYTVAVPLDQLADHGHPIEQLVDLAGEQRVPPATGVRP